MLTWEPDKERALESTFHDSIPFLLFAPDEFREELIMRLRGLYTSCNPRSTDNFIEELKRINEMLKDYDFGETVNIHIVHLQTILKPFNQTLAEHSIKLQELEKQVKSLKKYNKNSAKIKSSTIENISSAIDRKTSLDNIKAIGSELKLAEEEITNTQMNNLNHSDSVLNQTDSVLNQTKNNKIMISKRSLNRLQSTFSWNLLLYLRSKDNYASAKELATLFSTSNQKVYEAIFKLNKNFNDNIEKLLDEDGNRAYLWVETEESRDFFTQIENKDLHK
ncbi:MAG: hypothetical protein AB9861_12425 [Methanosarcina sp.]